MLLSFTNRRAEVFPLPPEAYSTQLSLQVPTNYLDSLPLRHIDSDTSEESNGGVPHAVKTPQKLFNAFSRTSPRISSSSSSSAAAVAAAAAAAAAAAGGGSIMTFLPPPPPPPVVTQDSLFAQMNPHHEHINGGGGGSLMLNGMMNGTLEDYPTPPPPILDTPGLGPLYCLLSLQTVTVEDVFR